MKRLLFAFALLLVPVTASAQSTTRVQAQAVATCGGQSLTAGVFYPATQDLTGALCTNAAGGGGGSVTQGTVPWVVSGQGTAGTAATGVVTVQGIASMTKLLVTPDSVALPANQSVNEAQINGVTPLMGNGVTGTGSQRVTIASDNTAFSVNAAQATAANLNATVVGTGTFAVQAATQGAVNVTLTDCSSTITVGATAQNAFTASASRHGFTIANIDTSEVMWINFTGTAAASGAGSYPLAPASTVTFSGLNSFSSPLGMGINTALSVIAATTAHKFSCTVW